MPIETEGWPVANPGVSDDSAGKYPKVNRNYSGDRVRDDPGAASNLRDRRDEKVWI